MARSTGLDPAIIERLASDLADHAALRVPAALSGQVMLTQQVRNLPDGAYCCCYTG
jgi:hypothetical protein